jgi:hypothetical protein
MGLFGDSDMKKLNKSLDMAKVMLSMSSSMGPTRMPNGTVMTDESVMNDLGPDVVLAARALAAKGRKDEAVARIDAVRKTDDSPSAAVWNDFLDQVIAQIEPEAQPAGVAAEPTEARADAE